MGIKGLLPLLSGIEENKKISCFTGETIGVDSYCWIHRGSYSCAQDLALKKPTDKYVKFVMNRVQMLLDHNITPIMVFDGARYIAKQQTEENRRQTKKDNLALAMKYYNSGDKSKAFEYFRRCVEVTHEMALQVITKCKEIGVSCIVAPYEADAQLAYLFKKNIISGVISEDTDLLAFGVKRVFFKMDANGVGKLINMDRASKLNLFGKNIFDHEKFLHLCIMSGCDYLDNIKNFAIRKALNVIKSCSDMEKVFQQVKSIHNIFPDDYPTNFYTALNMFKNHIVFDIELCSAVEMTSGLVHTTLKSRDLLFNEYEIYQMALGNIDPSNKRLIGNNKYTDFTLFYTRVSPERVFEIITNWSTKPIDQSPQHKTTGSNKSSILVGTVINSVKNETVLNSVKNGSNQLNQLNIKPENKSIDEQSIDNYDDILKLYQPDDNKENMSPTGQKWQNNSDSKQNYSKPLKRQDTMPISSAMNLHKSKSFKKSVESSNTQGIHPNSNVNIDTGLNNSTDNNIGLTGSDLSAETNSLTNSVSLDTDCKENSSSFNYFNSDTGKSDNPKPSEIGQKTDSDCFDVNSSLKRIKTIYKPKL